MCKLHIPIDRVPTSKSCVFCIGMEFPFFQHLTVCWALPVARIIFLKRCYASEFRSKRRWNGSAQVEIFRSKWSSLTGRSGPTENCRSIFKHFRFQSRSSSSLHIVVKMADGSDGSVYQCNVCKLQTQDLNFLLMHSCTRGSGTAVYLNLVFLLVFISL